MLSVTEWCCIIRNLSQQLWVTGYDGEEPSGQWNEPWVKSKPEVHWLWSAVCKSNRKRLTVLPNRKMNPKLFNDLAFLLQPVQRIKPSSRWARSNLCQPIFLPTNRCSISSTVKQLDRHDAARLSTSIWIRRNSISSTIDSLNEWHSASIARHHSPVRRVIDQTERPLPTRSLFRSQTPVWHV